MTRVRGFALALLFAAVCAAAVVLVVLQGSLGADASTLSRGARGWLAARRYLEGRGCRVALLDKPLEAQTGGGALVLAFPWQRLDVADPRPPLLRHLQAGGTVVLAFSGARPGLMETDALGALGLAWREVRGDPPLHPLRWRAYALEEWALRPEPRLSRAMREVRIGAPTDVPRMPASGRPLLSGPDGAPVAFVYPHLRGRVIALPAEALSNARLDEPGNADLLETLRASLGDEWTFDEYHHGLSAPASAADAGSRRVVDHWLAQLVFLYLMAILALARRFGPSWSDPPAITGSAGSFLLGLGALHHRLGHHREAARALLARVVELDPRLGVDADARIKAEDGRAEDFLTLASDVARHQSRHGRNG